MNFTNLTLLMNEQFNELAVKKIKLNGIKALIQQELDVFEAKCRETNDSEKINYYFDIYQNNIRLLQEIIPLI